MYLNEKELFAAETRFIKVSILTLSYRTTNAEFYGCYTRASNNAQGFKTTLFITLHIAHSSPVCTIRKNAVTLRSECNNHYFVQAQYFTSFSRQGNQDARNDTHNNERTSKRINQPIGSYNFG